MKTSELRTTIVSLLTLLVLTVTDMPAQGQSVEGEGSVDQFPTALLHLRPGPLPLIYQAKTIMAHSLVIPSGSKDCSDSAMPWHLREPIMWRYRMKHRST